MQSWVGEESSRQEAGRSGRKERKGGKEKSHVTQESWNSRAASKLRALGA